MRLHDTWCGGDLGIAAGYVRLGGTRCSGDLGVADMKMLLWFGMGLGRLE